MEKNNFELLVAAQSYTFEIHPQPQGGDMAVLTFYALPNMKENMNNKVLAKVAIPYEGFKAIPGVVEDVIQKNNLKRKTK